MRVSSIKTNRIVLEGDISTVYDQLDHFLLATNGWSFMGELNNVQLHAGTSPKDSNKDRFASKYDIPLYFVNLVLYKWGLEVTE
ncbi:hypothetical protein OGZ37_05865 [Lactococcus lactis]|uniref:hypothetical protein n=1 Tax=Lactococcus lactis TaxID=1358 RepID=UPI0024181CB9|nr:hypothetical protein [Lactococcus lactis]MDG4966101.1 hypothetical protein [Lactococcus lactis]